MNGIKDTEENIADRKSDLKNAIKIIYQREIKKKIERVQDLDEQDRIYSEYVRNLIGTDELEDEGHNFKDYEFMKKGQTLKELKEEELNFESLAEVPTVIVGENEEEVDKQNED